MLKAVYEAIQPNMASSFSVRTFAQEAFTAPYHYHPEYELTLIIQGTGQRFVGSHVADYGPGDLVLLGSDVPHCWKSDPGPPGQQNAVSVVVQFTRDFMGELFFARNELYAVSQLLLRSTGGLRFASSAATPCLTPLLQLSQEVNPLDRLLRLLKLLQLLATIPDYEVLDSHQHVGTLNSAERERFHRVMEYVVEHYRGEITLARAAAVANLTPTAFCKYFKALTRRTLMETVIDYRLQYATQQLMRTTKPVADICYDSGFGDISYFNKTFKAQLRRSPLQYRRLFRHEQTG